MIKKIKKNHKFESLLIKVNKLISTDKKNKNKQSVKVLNIHFYSLSIFHLLNQPW